MGIAEVLTILFIALKLLGVIGWSWWLVCFPEIIAGVLYVILFIAVIVVNVKTRKEIRKHFSEIERFKL